MVLLLLFIAGVNGQLLYSILSVLPPSMSSSFTIDVNTGAISTAELLDRESNTQVDLNVQVQHSCLNIHNMWEEIV